MAPFALREVGIHPLAKPGFLVPPTQSFSDEDLADATALHANAFDPVQVVHQPIQRPGRIPLFAQVLGPTESCLNDLADQRWLVGHRSSRARSFFQPLQALLVKTMEPIAHHPLAHVDLLCNLGRQLALTGQPDDLRSFEFPHGRVSGMHESFNRLLLFFAQFSQS